MTIHGKRQKRLAILGFLGLLGISTWLLTFPKAVRVDQLSQAGSPGLQFEASEPSSPDLEASTSPSKNRIAVAADHVLGSNSQSTEGLEPVILAKGFPETWLRNPRVLDMARHYKETPESIVQAILSDPNNTGNRFFESAAYVELGPWPPSGSTLTERLITSYLGRVVETRLAVEAEVLGVAMEPFVHSNFGIGSDDDLYGMVESAIHSILEGCEDEYSLFSSSAAFAISDKVRRGAYNRYPHTILSRFRRHVDEHNAKMIWAIGEILPGGWIVEFRLIQGEYPVFDQHRRGWRAARKETKQMLSKEIDVLKVSIQELRLAKTNS